MKRVFIIVLMLLNISFAMADVYTDGLKKLLNSNARELLVSSEQLKMLQTADKTGNGIDEVFNMVADIMAPYYRDNMTEEEFLQMIDFLMKPEYSTLGIELSKMSIANGSYQQTIQSAVNIIVSGGKPEDVQLKSCSTTMKEKVERLFNEMDVDRTILVSMEQMFTLLNAQAANAPAEKKEQVRKVCNGMMDYYKNNYRTIIMNNYIDTVTEQELDVVLSITKESFYPSYKKACTAMSNGLIQTVMEMMNKGVGK